MAMDQEMDYDLEEERVRQREIIDTLLGYKHGGENETCKSHFPTRRDPGLHEQKEDLARAGRSGNGSSQLPPSEVEVSNSHVTEDLSYLFSGHQFSFLPQSDEKEGENGGEEGGLGEELEKAPKMHSPDNMADRSQGGNESAEQARTLFFFHWGDPVLANRLDHSFHQTRSQRQLEQNWPARRLAAKQLLRHSHKHALRHAAQRRRTAAQVGPTSDM